MLAREGNLCVVEIFVFIGNATISFVNGIISLNEENICDKIKKSEWKQVRILHETVAVRYTERLPLTHRRRMGTMPLEGSEKAADPGSGVGRRAVIETGTLLGTVRRLAFIG